MRDNTALEIVLSAVNSVYGASYTLEDVYKGTRYRPLVIARQLYWYLKRTYSKSSTLHSLGAEFGKDHATVLHGLRNMEGLVDVRDKAILRILYLCEDNFCMVLKRTDEDIKEANLKMEQKMTLYTQRERAKVRTTKQTAKASLYHMYKLVSNDNLMPGWLKFKAEKEYRKALQMLEP